MINVFPETPFVARTNTEVDSRNLPGAFVYLTVGLTNPCRHDSVKTMKDAATKVYRWVVVIKTKAESEDGSRDMTPHFRPLAHIHGPWHDYCSMNFHRSSYEYFASSLTEGMLHFSAVWTVTFFHLLTDFVVSIASMKICRFVRWVWSCMIKQHTTDSQVRMWTC